MSQLVILDGEAVRALGDPAHPKHRRVVSHVQIVAGRKFRGGAVQVVVPVAVRVEAGWDRASAAWAFLNRLRIADVPLDQAHSDAAAASRSVAVTSVAGAHLGAVIQLSSATQVTVVTGDPEGARLVAADQSVTVVGILARAQWLLGREISQTEEHSSFCESCSVQARRRASRLIR